MDGGIDTSQRRTATHYKQNKVLLLQTSAVAVFAPKHSESYQQLDCGVFLYRPSAINSIMQIKFRFKIIVISKTPEQGNGTANENDFPIIRG
jgi:hypothetical protein